MTSRRNTRRTTRRELASKALVKASTSVAGSQGFGFQTRADVLGYVEAWLSSLQSEETRRAYRQDLEEFVRWYGERRLSYRLDLVQLDDANEYARHLDAFERRNAAGQVRRYSNSTKARKLAALSSFYDYGLKAGRLLYSPFEHVKRPKLPKESPRASLSREQAERLLEVAEAASVNRRAVVALCLLAGLRVSEALSLTAENLVEQDGHRVIRVLGKGGTEALVPLSPRALRLLKPALDAARRDGGPLVRTDEGLPAYRQQAAKWLETLGRRAGLPKTWRLTPHTLRHTAATLAYKAGADVSDVMRFLRHADVSTTLRYVHATALDNSAAYVLADSLN